MIIAVVMELRGLREPTVDPALRELTVNPVLPELKVQPVPMVDPQTARLRAIRAIKQRK